jgi:hypothetical protein
MCFIFYLTWKICDHSCQTLYTLGNISKFDKLQARNQVLHNRKSFSQLFYKNNTYLNLQIVLPKFYRVINYVLLDFFSLNKSLACQRSLEKGRRKVFNLAIHAPNFFDLCDRSKIFFFFFSTFE